MKKRVIILAAIAATAAFCQVQSVYAEDVSDYSALQQAINNGVSEINLASGTYTLTSAIGALGGTDVTINGNSAIIDAVNTYSGITVKSGQSLTVDNATFQNFYSTSSGSVINNTKGTLALIDCTFLNNTVSGSSKYGGAIYSTDTITEMSGTFSGNSAQRGGGVLYNSGTVNKITGTYSNNSSDTTTSAYGRGGVIYNTGTIDSINAEFTSNTAKLGAVIYNTGTISSIEGNFNYNTAINNYSSTSVQGGAIYNTGTITAINADFTENSASSDLSGAFGGAIYNASKGYIERIEGTFTGNYAASSANSVYGGAIASTGGNSGSGIGTITASFINNYTYSTADTADAGAIYNSANIGIDAISSSTFSGNYSYSTVDWTTGGAITNYSEINSISDSTFTGNYTQSDAESSKYGAFGGAIYTGEYIGSITNTVFSGNYAITDYINALGGAIMNEGTIDEISGSTFSNNYAKSENGYVSGGAIANYGEITSIDADFTGNYVYTNGEDWADGGAVYNGGIISSITGNFIGNHSYSAGDTATGGAISNDGTIGSIINSSFYNNYAEGVTAMGGAIYTVSDLNILSQDGYTTVFSGNSTSSDGTEEDNAIYVNSNEATLTFSMTNGGSVYMEDSINGVDGYNVVIEGDDTETTTFYLLNDIYNADVTFNSTTINTINNEVHVYDFNSLTITGDTNMVADVDLENEEMDRFTADSYGEHSGYLNVTGMNLLSDASDDSDITAVYFAETGLMDYVTLNGSSSGSLDLPGYYQTTAYTPIYKYNVLYDTTTDYGDGDGGYFLFTKGDNIFVVEDTSTDDTTDTDASETTMLSGTDTNSNISVVSTGNPSDAFNPAVLAGPVAAQIGGYLVQLNSYDEAFRNMDMYMLMTKKQRQALKLKNKYASIQGEPVFDVTLSKQEKKSAWFRPYTTFEKVPLHNGPKVSNVAYGSFFGDESEMYDLGHGWDGMWGVYAGYNGSHQSYDGVSMYQNGGTLGLVGMAYKGNFFTGLTVNAGANAGEANTMYGNENFTMLMAGIASKTGYNIELADGKFIIQPHLLMSYSFVNTFDYTNAAGVQIDSDPLHAIQIEPGIKFIGNLKNGWQPYAGVSVVWNIMDNTRFTANDVSLPDMSVDPYVKYGVGVRKSWGERLAGYFQTYVTNGGRNGIGLQLGFRWTLGKTETPKPSMHYAPAPALPKLDFLGDSGNTQDAAAPASSGSVQTKFKKPSIRLNNIGYVN